MSAPLSPEIERWKKYLRSDPTRWLLADDDPSIVVNYQLDIAHRPEDAPGVIATRERALYSEPVQAIFRAQNELGFWEDAEAPAQPYYRGTIWNLALLAELGIPRTSRRARNACEYLLGNFLTQDGSWAGLNGVESGYLVHALAYFHLAEDERVKRAGRALWQKSDSFEEKVAALWGWTGLGGAGETLPEVNAALAQVLDAAGGVVAADERATQLLFPQFEPLDMLFVLRVLAAYGRVSDARAAPLLELLVSKQNEQAQWRVERDVNERLVTPFEAAGEPSRWITLNALRVIVTRMGALA